MNIPAHATDFMFHLLKDNKSLNLHYVAIYLGAA